MFSKKNKRPYIYKRKLLEDIFEKMPFTIAKRNK